MFSHPSPFGRDYFEPHQIDRSDEILQRLAREADFETELSSANKNALFARLYFFTTKGWVEHADSSGDRELLHFVVEYFYHLYRCYVVDMESSAQGGVADHWVTYQRMTERGEGEALRPADLIALFFGIRAHIRFDLAEAICFANLRYVQRFGYPPQPDRFHALLFGGPSNRIFRQASTEFVSSLMYGSRQRPVLKNALRFASLLWLPIFQAARSMAWNEAQRSIMTGQRIERRHSGAVGLDQL